MTEAGPILAVIPHPDDEVLGAGCTLLALRDRGHRIVVLACGLGRPADHERRRGELTAACRLAGFELDVLRPSPLASTAEQRHVAGPVIAAAVGERLQRAPWSLIVAPCVSDAHPAHTMVAQATLAAVEMTGRDMRVACWSLWSTLRVTTTVAAIDESLVARASLALRAHAGELERAPYDGLLRARARFAALIEPERALGFGTTHPAIDLAEALYEIRHVGPRSAWQRAAGRVVAAGDVLADEPVWCDS